MTAKYTSRDIVRAAFESAMYDEPIQVWDDLSYHIMSVGHVDSDGVPYVAPYVALFETEDTDTELMRLNNAGTYIDDIADIMLYAIDTIEWHKVVEADPVVGTEAEALMPSFEDEGFVF